MNVQFKKGVLELCVLVLTASKDRYGYELVQSISEKFAIAEGTVYPLLRRLTLEGYFTTYLEESTEGPPRKYYKLSQLGLTYMNQLVSEWSERWIVRNNFPDKVNIEINDDILSPWRRLIYEKRNLSDDNSELIEHLLKVLCLTVERSVRQRATDSPRTNLYIPYRIKRYVEQHVTEPITLAGIAKIHGISASTASHLFKRTFGYSIMRYVVEIRLSIASERILHSVVSLEEISEASGFHSYPYFCRAFRSRFHMPPSLYRKHHLRFGVTENSLYQP